MANVEKSGMLKYKDKAGNVYFMLPITTISNVDGLAELVEELKVLSRGIVTTGNGGAYEVTVPGVTTLEAGLSFVIIPHVQSTTISPTLNVNGLGAKYLRVHISGYSGTTGPGQSTNWLAPNKPIKVTYDGLFWVTEMIIPSANNLYGNVKAEDVDYSNTNSGLTAETVQAAIDELTNGKVSAQLMTTAEYDALETKDENVLYMLTDDTTEADIKAHILSKSNPHEVTAEQVGADAIGSAEQALKDAKAYVDSSIQTALYTEWEASY